MTALPRPRFIRRARSSLLTLALITGLLATGCGQKGNLYLPNQKKKIPATQPSPNTQAQPDTSPSNSPPAPARPAGPTP